MAEFSTALVILVPLGLLIYLSLALLRMGMKSSELTDAARQRLSGCGIMLLYLAVLGLVITTGAGVAWMAHVLHFPK
jgi:hypothetical protein